MMPAPMMRLNLNKTMKKTNPINTKLELLESGFTRYAASALELVDALKERIEELQRENENLQKNIERIEKHLVKDNAH